MNTNNDELSALYLLDFAKVRFLFWIRYSCVIRAQQYFLIFRFVRAPQSFHMMVVSSFSLIEPYMGGLGWRIRAKAVCFLGIVRCRSFHSFAQCSTSDAFAHCVFVCVVSSGIANLNGYVSMIRHLLTIHFSGCILFVVLIELGRRKFFGMWMLYGW